MGVKKAKDMKKKSVTSLSAQSGTNIVTLNLEREARITKAEEIFNDLERMKPPVDFTEPRDSYVAPKILRRFTREVMIHSEAEYETRGEWLCLIRWRLSAEGEPAGCWNEPGDGNGGWPSHLSTDDPTDLNKAVWETAT